LIVKSSEVLENGSDRLVARDITNLSGNVSPTLIRDIVIQGTTNATEPQ